MPLKDKFRFFAEPIPSDCVRVKVTIGPDILELAVSRRDLSPALEREIRDRTRNDPDFDPDDEKTLSLPIVEAIAARATAAVKGYKVYDAGISEAEAEEIEWLTDLTEADLRGMGAYFWPIINAIWEKLNGPNPKAGDEGSTTSSPATQ